MLDSSTFATMHAKGMTVSGSLEMQQGATFKGDVGT